MRTGVGGIVLRRCQCFFPNGKCIQTMLVLEVSYSLLLLHFHSREHTSACFHSHFLYKTDVRVCQDFFPLLPFAINKLFPPLLAQSSLDGWATQAAASFWGDGEQLKPCPYTCSCSKGEQRAAFPVPKPPALLPRGSVSSHPTDTARQESEQKFAFGCEGGGGQGKERSRILDLSEVPESITIICLAGR